MDKDFLAFITQLGALIGFLKLRKDLKAGERKKLDEALDALRKAAHATKGYYAAQKAGKGIDKEKEHDLAHLWITCAERVRDYDRQLADRFKLKRNYWLSPEKWSDEQIKAARIGLDDITREAEILLDPSFKKSSKKPTK